MDNNNPKNLDDFIGQNEASGAIESRDSHFTVDRDKALTKLAGFRLPQPSYWLLKCVQAGVAAGCGNISFRFGKNFTEIGFNGGSFSVEDLDTALLTPRKNLPTEIQHLVVALRSVGFGQFRPFTFVSQSSANQLSFDGRRLELSTRPVDTAPANLLRVSCSQAEADRRALSKAARSTNAEGVMILEKFAHTCPVPLTVDGRRIDALELNPDFGWSYRSETLGLGFGKSSSLPKFKLQSSLQRQEDTRHTPLAQAFEIPHPLFYSVCLKKAFSGVDEGITLAKGTSKLLWVDYGVLVAEEALPIPASPVTIGVYLSAQGLRKDLSGFSLLNNEEKQQRLRHTRKALSQLSQEVAQLGQTVKPFKNETPRKAVSLALVALGLGSAVVSPPAALVFFAGAYFTKGRSHAESIRDQLTPEHFHRLAQSLARL